MPTDEDLLFGMIAFSQGYCTQAQIDECVQMRSLGGNDTAVGGLLLIRRYITPPQHAKVLKIQKLNRQVRASQTHAGKEAEDFGRIAVREGLLSKEEVQDCLREQAREGWQRTLEVIMVEQGYLTAAQGRFLLGKQRKRLMSCPICRLSFAVRSLSKGTHVSCPRCKVSLREGRPAGSIRTQAEFATQVLQAAQGELPATTRPLRRVNRSPGRRVTAP